MTSGAFTDFLRRLGHVASKSRQQATAEQRAQSEAFWTEATLLHGPEFLLRQRRFRRVVIGLLLLVVLAFAAVVLDWAYRGYRWTGLLQILMFLGLSVAHYLAVLDHRDHGWRELLAGLDDGELIPFWLLALPRGGGSTAAQRRTLLERLSRHLPAREEALPDDARRRLVAELRSLARRAAQRQPITGTEETFLIAALLRADLLAGQPRIEESVRSLAESRISPHSERIRTAADQALLKLRP